MILKYIYKKAISIFPFFIQNLIFDIRFYFINPKQLNARKQYKFTDEHLKFVHILAAINYIRVAGDEGKVLPQTYFEFGCHSGRTFSAAINASKFLSMNNANYFAFDSFQGLPETNSSSDGIFKFGTFFTSREAFIKIIKTNTGVKLNDRQVFEGFYNNTLTSNLSKNLPKAGVVHIDVDLYSSTVEVLNFLRPLLVQGTVILFDDWYCFPAGSLMGERRAFSEFLQENLNISVEPWKAYSTFGQSFFVTKVPNSL